MQDPSYHMDAITMERMRDMLRVDEDIPATGSKKRVVPSVPEPRAPPAKRARRAGASSASGVAAADMPEDPDDAD